MKNKAIHRSPPAQKRVEMNKPVEKKLRELEKKLKHIEREIRKLLDLVRK